jgi:hypothetical protein
MKILKCRPCSCIFKAQQYLFKDMVIDELLHFRRWSRLGPVLCGKLHNATRVTASIVILRTANGRVTVEAMSN